jgi:DNA-binding MarR family transcriptional regulator
MGIVAMVPTGNDAAENDADVVGRMRTVIGRLGRRLRWSHADKDLSPSQYDVLGTIVRRGPMRLSDLVAIEGLNPTMLSRVAGKLERAGLVVRTPDSHDGRVAHLAATGAGQKLHDEIRTERTDALLRAFSQLTEDQRRALTAALPVLEFMAEALKRQT